MTEERHLDSRMYAIVWNWLAAKYEDPESESQIVSSPSPYTDFKIEPSNIAFRMIECLDESSCVKQICFEVDQKDYDQFDQYVFVLIAFDKGIVQAITDNLESANLPSEISVVTGYVSPEDRFVEVHRMGTLSS
jgi:hypothetical protein